MQRISQEKESQAIELYRQGLSEDKIARTLLIGHASVHRILVRNNEQRRDRSDAISAGVTKYPKTDFSGDLAEKARVCGFSEDFNVRYIRRHIRVGTTTTHSAQITLFQEIFGPYGHISVLPHFNAVNQLRYDWSLQGYLNESFCFLMEYKSNPTKFLKKNIERGGESIYIGALADAESWVGIRPKRRGDRNPIAAMDIVNKNLQLLQWVQRIVGGRIYRITNAWTLRFERWQAIEVLRMLPITHEEKVAAKVLILHYADNGGIGLEALRAYRDLRRRIDEEVRLYTLHARLEWIGRHGAAHPKDPDQTIP